MTTIRTALGIACAAAFILLMSNQALADEEDSRKACESLAALSSQVFRVDTSQWVATSRQAAGPGGATTEVPAHCLFRVVMDPRPSGIEGVSYGTGIELRLPLAWNGRLLFQGGGGLDGSLNPAFGSVSGFPSALTRGFAVVSTDGGHRGRSNVDASFAVDQQAKLDLSPRRATNCGLREKRLQLPTWRRIRPCNEYARPPGSVRIHYAAARSIRRQKHDALIGISARACARSSLCLISAVSTFSRGAPGIRAARAATRDCRDAGRRGSACRQDRDRSDRPPRLPRSRPCSRRRAPSAWRVGCIHPHGSS